MMGMWEWRGVGVWEYGSVGGDHASVKIRHE